MRFVADDGKTFSSLKECEEYEKEILDKEKERSQRADEVYEAYEKYRELRDKYYEDYPVGLVELEHLFEKLF